MYVDPIVAKSRQNYTLVVNALTSAGQSAGALQAATGLTPHEVAMVLAVLLDFHKATAEIDAASGRLLYRKV